MTRGDLQKVLGRIKRNGALTIRDIDDDKLREKDHEGRAASLPSVRCSSPSSAATHGKPARGHAEDLRADNAAFRLGPLAEARAGKRPHGLSADRALRAQGIVSLNSICHLDAPRKAAIRKLIGQRVRRGELVPVALEGASRALGRARDARGAARTPAASCTSSTRSIRW